MSAGRDKKARTKERKVQLARSLAKREATRERMLTRRLAKRARRAFLKSKNKASAP